MHPQLGKGVKVLEKSLLGEGSKTFILVGWVTLFGGWGGGGSHNFEITNLIYFRDI